MTFFSVIRPFYRRKFR